jgi:NAD(P)-dependent dehydrogenase (short-subunit alcohol dehydrogenase family)
MRPPCHFTFPRRCHILGLGVDYRMAGTLYISKGNLKRGALSKQVAVVTGAGSGIGFEAARSLAWLGAHVVIAEIDKRAGSHAASVICEEMGEGQARFVHTDVGESRDVARLANRVLKDFGQLDIVLNNAAVEPLGAVSATPVEAWDSSYRVNLRGPVLFARAFLPPMLKRNSGIFVCVSSVGGAYMGPYEVLKRAQVELANTIDAECEGTGVIAFTIGPGLVTETRGASEGIPRMAEMLGKTVDEFTEMSKAALISAEAAGAGFAAAIALASSFRGQETSSQEALRAAGIQWADARPTLDRKALSGSQLSEASQLAHVLKEALQEQLRQWQELGVFQRGWMFRDFTKRAGVPLEKYVDSLASLETRLKTGEQEASRDNDLPLERLAAFFQHMQDLTKGFVKDEKVRNDQMGLQRSWEEAARQLDSLLN